MCGSAVWARTKSGVLVGTVPRICLERRCWFWRSNLELGSGAMHGCIDAYSEKACCMESEGMQRTVLYYI